MQLRHHILACVTVALGACGGGTEPGPSGAAQTLSDGSSPVQASRAAALIELLDANVTENTLGALPGKAGSMGTNFELTQRFSVLNTGRLSRVVIPRLCRYSGGTTSAQVAMTIKRGWDYANQQTLETVSVAAQQLPTCDLPAPVTFDFSALGLQVTQGDQLMFNLGQVGNDTSIAFSTVRFDPTVVSSPPPSMGFFYPAGDQPNSFYPDLIIPYQTYVMPALQPWNFSGFLQPVDAAPTVNTAKAGSAIPVKFSFGEDKGMNIFSGSGPKAAPMACSSAPTDVIEQTVDAASNSGLSFDPVTLQYTYVWKTDKAWANTCMQLQLPLADGTTKTALFKFTR